MRSRGFQIRKTMCQTCIYRLDTPLDLAKLEAEISDGRGGFTGYRICHHHEDTCCRGFWDKHKDEFQIGQVAQRLDVVEFADEGDKFEDGYP